MSTVIIKNRVKKAFNQFGYEVKRTENANRSSTLKKHLATLFDEFQIQCVLDVGACMGGFRDFVRNRVGYTGLIISFEPVKKNAELLKRKYKDDQHLIVYNFALGDENTTAEINVTKNSDFSSFLNPDNSLVKKFKDVNTVVDTEVVKVKTLDSIIDSIKDKCSLNHTYLKIDTQGYDLKVMQGSLMSLSHIPALQTEASLLPIYNCMPSFSDTYAFLKEASFDISGFFPIHRRFDAACDRG